MVKRHLKRLAAPKTWLIERKTHKWVVRPRPGPHPLERCLPLLLIVRDILGYADTAREARRIISSGKILVDGVPRKDYKFPVGLMDVLSIPDMGEHYRVLLDERQSITLVRIDEEEARYKLCRIDNKTTVKGGHIQLNLHDGRNILVRVSDPTNPVEDIYRTGDVLKIEVPSQRILDHIRMEKGNLAMIIGGKNTGRIGIFEELVVLRSPSPNVAILRDVRDGSEIRVIKPYVFMIGREKPEITIPGG